MVWGFGGLGGVMVLGFRESRFADRASKDG